MFFTGCAGSHHTCHFSIGVCFLLALQARSTHSTSVIGVCYPLAAQARTMLSTPLIGVFPFDVQAHTTLATLKFAWFLLVLQACFMPSSP
jgi:hypothetical protein